MNLDETSRIRALERILQEEMALYGYAVIDMPVIEDAEIFLTRAGDSIIERLFTFERFGHLLALRPEFTAAAAHRYAQEASHEPVRWQMSGAIFEDEPADISRQYQKHAIGAEFIGQSATSADAEIVAMAAKGIEKLGIADFQIVLGHVGLLRHVLGRFNLDNRTERLLLGQRERLKREGKSAVLEHLQGVLTLSPDVPESLEELATSGQTQYMLDILLDSTRYGTTMGGRSREEIAQRLLKKRQRALEYEQIVSALDFLQEWGQLEGNSTEVFLAIREFLDEKDELGQAMLDEWQLVIEQLGAYGLSLASIQLQADLAKNWDYYTGLVFGIRVNGQTVASGGRYDGLTKLLGSEDAVPAVGFAYYSDALLAVQAMPPQKPLFTLDSRDELLAIQWASTLRANGIAIMLVKEDAQIRCADEIATYNGKSYRLDELVQELSQ